MSETPTVITLDGVALDAPWRPVSIGWRADGGSWTHLPADRADGVNLTMTADPGGKSFRITLEKADAAALDIAFAVPRKFQAFGGGERFETLDLRGQSVRYYLENFGLGNGTYLPSPWIATTLGYGLYLPDEAPAVFHIAAPFDPNMLRIQVEGTRLELEIHLGDLGELYAALIERIGPPLMPEESFFDLWKAGDWRIENAKTVQADIDGHAALGLPMSVKLIDAYWASEVHSFAFDTQKYPDADAMIRRMAEIYGGRAGAVGGWRLARTVIAHLVATGAVAAGDDLIHTVAGGGILAKVSRRFGEGVVNGALTARVGIAAMEVCRPLPFIRQPRPRVGNLIARGLKGLFGDDDAATKK